MMSLQDAVREDMNGSLVRAADGYEQIIQAECAPLGAYLNLAVLYWQCTDYGFNAGHALGLEFIHKAGERYQALLAEAGRCYPHHSEIRFWTLYCDYVTLGEPPFVEECRALVAAAGKPLVPYFYLYAASEGQEYLREASELLAECLKHPTVKNKYVISVIKGVASRAKSRVLAGQKL